MDDDPVGDEIAVWIRADDVVHVNKAGRPDADDARLLRDEADLATLTATPTVHPQIAAVPAVVGSVINDALYLQVLHAVVLFVLVLVVNRLVYTNRPAKVLLHDQDMLVDRSAVVPRVIPLTGDSDITVTVNALATDPRGLRSMLPIDASLAVADELREFIGDDVLVSAARKTDRHPVNRHLVEGP